MLSLKGISKIYEVGSERVSVLNGVTLDIQAREFCAIVGPSGSGKSTLMNIMGLLDRPTSGKVLIDGEDMGAASADDTAAARNRLLGFVFQSFELLPRLTVWENVALPLHYRRLDSVTRKRLALEMLGMVGLSDRAYHRPSELSGGQRQRVAIARALIGQPKIILADEPTGSLDSVTAAQIMDLFKTLNAQTSVTVIMITHDQGIAAQCRRRIDILDGRIVGDLTQAPADCAHD
ncbi:ABC transporter ATP-binding protein [Asticcacaulis benevestitus]|uniref:ABC transporter domain-containing protein n=1 Tax=Asticcacaulis benevestitus DSM 16100 = ATCC BAA-896 TaxID=1121022 RepID=V4PVY2_9CAUL|nr:ABC transporter ATP-binding protein [Asticcacaulis benevestitus]ESQ92546.1 hypothetical protein ABENE_07875 [Asticcacaulis benevestitus DSM 16100 = ATCC BAA-896]